MIECTYEDDNCGTYHLFEQGEFEFLNPLDHYKSTSLHSMTKTMISVFRLKFPDFPQNVIEKVAKEKANEFWQDKMSKLDNVELEGNLKNLLSSDKKAEQIKLLKGLSISSDQLFKFYLYAASEGFTLSQYKGEELPKDISRSDMPKVTELKEEEVLKIGDTSLSDSQLKHAVNFRKKTIAKILDKDNEWHCLYITFKSIAGKESWQNGQTHFHYISHSFGISRDELVDRVKKNDAPSSPVHINLNDYGSQGS